MKRVLVLALALVMVLSLVPALGIGAAAETQLLATFCEQDGTPASRSNKFPLASLGTIVHRSDFIKLYTGTQETPTPLEGFEVSSSDSDIISVKKAANDETGTYYELSYNSIGSATLTWTMDEVSYSQSFSVGYEKGILMCDIGSEKKIENYYGIFSLRNTPAGDIRAYIAYSNGTQLIEIDRIEVIEGDAITIIEEGDHYLISTKAGFSDLMFHAGEYQQPVTMFIEGSEPAPGPGGPGPMPIFSEQVFDNQYRVIDSTLNLVNYNTTRFWAMSESGYTMDEVNSLNVSAEPQSKTPGVTPVLREDGSGCYDIAIDLPLPEAAGAVEGGYSVNFSGLFNGSWRVCVEVEGNQMSADEYTVGFGFYNQNDNILVVHEPTVSYPYHSEKGANPDNPYVSMQEYSIFVGTKTTDEQGINVYTPAEGVTATITSAKIETVMGDPHTFSFSPDSLLTEFSGAGPDAYVPQTLQMYVKDGYTGYCRLRAIVDVTKDGESIGFGPVSLIFTASRAESVSFNYDEDIEKTEFISAKIDTLTEYIEYIADNYIDEETYPSRDYTINLGAETYTENIEIDSRFSGYDRLTINGVSGEDSGSTVIEGGIDLGGTSLSINNVHFRSNNGETEKAVFNGDARVQNCSFYNYATAVETDSFLSDCVFINNDVAWKINYNSQFFNLDMISRNNSFINNGVAVHITTIRSENSSYYFRITDSNFINNGKDFVAATGGTLYMYRNYFGELKKLQGNKTILPGRYAEEKHNSLVELQLDEMAACKNASISKYLQRRAAVIEVEEGTSVIANPRWKYPIKNWWKINNKLIDIHGDGNSLMMLSTEGETAGDGGEYEDILVIDWKNSTTIITDEADELIIDAETFTDDASKVIDVVDKNENALGSWIF